MTVEEIFSTISAHMRKGLMIHKQLMNIFGFLNLCGYQKCHEHHYFEESKNYIELNNFYLKHYCKIIEPKEVNNPELIPSSWYKYEKINVDNNTRRNSIKESTLKWVEWESETKKLLENSYKELEHLGEMRAAIEISYFLKEVSDELADAREFQINLEAIGYDLPTIIDEQEKIYKKYNKRG